MLNFKPNLIAGLFLGAMAVLMFFSSLGDSATMDELAHIPAGFSYLTQKDHRLNPEHPPLIKDLSAIPLLFLNLNFPTNIKAWADDINGQWDMGRIFLYESGNNPDRILFWSRLPMMILALIFGWLFFNWVKKIYGNKVGLIALFFFSFSPTIIAHSRYVTTDLAASFGFFIGIAAFIRFLEKQTINRIILAGLAVGGALLLKFSVILLIPFCLLFGFLWLILANFDQFEFRAFCLKKLKMLAEIAAIFLIAALCVYLVYLFHVWNYPQERQVRDTNFILTSFGFRPAADLTVAMAKNSILRPIAQYLLGLLMVIQRSAGGNTTYFLGEVSAGGWWYYFPTAYLLKEPLAFLIFAGLALILALKAIKNSGEKTFAAAAEWMRGNFALSAGMIFIAGYWLISIRSPLNIGIRHVMPTYPFIYFLISRQIVRWFHFSAFPDPQNFREWLRTLYERYVKALPKYVLMTFLFIWLVLSAVIAFPNYLSYYNELGGGLRNGFKYIVDSNYDWGQDLRRLQNFVQKNKIEKIAVDYFGGGEPSFYLGNQFQPWWSGRGKPDPDKGDPEWLAVSATLRQGAENSYLWLRDYEPVARAGYSIFIYKF
ncbi:MAG: glycosyltransferase family 39 protein [Patescibacteria group bacterium]